MVDADSIAEKRAQLAQQTREKMNDTAMAGLARSDNIDDLIKQVKEVQLASLLGSSKPSVVLTDQTDLGDKMGELADKVASAISSLDRTETDAQQLSELKSLYIGLSQLKSAFTTGNGEIHKGIKLLIKAVESIRVSPTLTVPAPKVTVESAKVDLKPLQDTIREAFKPPVDEKIDLDCYKAQDIDNDTEGYQYVGFVNPMGNWYIIENNIKGNSLRYVFGKSGYQKAFKKASSYQYQLLNEAIDAVSS